MNLDYVMSIINISIIGILLTMDTIKDSMLAFSLVLIIFAVLTIDAKE